MKFFHITREDGVKSHSEQSAFFSAACAAKNIEYCRIIDSDLSLSEFNSLELAVGDLIYRSSTSRKAIALEHSLTIDQARTVFYDNHKVLTGRGGSYAIMKKAGLPVIPAIPFLPHKKRETIEFAENLGGFPIVVKVMGGMEGVGVMRVDSLESFNSVSDFIRGGNASSVMVMKYIPHKYYARLVVVGEQVVTASRDMAPLGDFRANARGPRDEQGTEFIPSADMAQAAVAAVSAMGIKTAGVDLLITNDKFYIAEANFPYNFAETQRRTGFDIAAAIISEMLQ